MLAAIAPAMNPDKEEAICLPILNWYFAPSAETKSFWFCMPLFYHINILTAYDLFKPLRRLFFDLYSEYANAQKTAIALR